MDKAKKAALLSALFFPGWGQIYLKAYKKGLVFIIFVLVGMLSLAMAVILSGLKIIKAAPFEKGTVHFADVISVCLKSIKALELQFFLPMIILLVLLWILSIVDAYQLGKKQALTSTIDADPEASSDPS